MSEAAPSVLSTWESFYVIVGSSGAALTGLMFVVITLIAGSPQRRSSRELDTFGTPTIVHFCVAVLIAAIVSAPWHTLVNVALLIGATGGAGLVYIGIIVWRAHRLTRYKPVLEDWIWHTILPVIAYLAYLVAGIALQRSPEGSLFVIGGATLLLLFIGIHNAWDTVTYIAIDMPNAPNESQAASAGWSSEAQPQPPTVAPR